MGLSNSLKRWIQRIFIIVFFVIFHSYSIAIANGERSQLDPQNTFRHMVVPGETLMDIARHYKIDWKQLIAHNKLLNPNQLLVGQFIYIPIVDHQLPDSLLYHASDNDTFASERKKNKSLINRKRKKSNIVSSKIDFDRPKVYFPRKKVLTNRKKVVLKPQDSVKLASVNTVAFSKKQGQSTNSKIIKPKSLHNSTYKTTQLDAIKTIFDKKNIREVKYFPENQLSMLERKMGNKLYGYYSNGEKLSELIKNFASGYAIPVVLTEELDIEVNGKFGPLKPVEFLEYMAKVYGFIWYYDGHSLYVYNSRFSQNKILSLNYISITKFKNFLKEIGVWDNRFYWKEQASNSVIYISGPPRYIEVVTQTANLLDQKEEIRQKKQLAVKVFHLKYAWATDKTFNFRGQNIVVPGVSTLLRNIIAGGGIAGNSNKKVKNQLLKPMQGVSQSSKKEHSDLMLNQENKASANNVLINADPRMNTIIVHDLEHKMPMYETLIQSLDKPSKQVEISVSIIDVNSQDVSELGIDWGHEDSKIDIKSNSGFESFSTVIGLKLNYFNAKLRMLTDEGRAKIVSRPSILTLDNLEAVLDNSSTFYVKVESTQDAELFPVTSGTVVQVTPRIVNEVQDRKIHMSVNIQNGSDVTTKDGTLPKITNSSINTQAIVNESESLLIGGFVQETERENFTKVPVLNRIPILGSIFKNKKKVYRKQVRLFLITPRILDMNGQHTMIQN